MRYKVILKYSSFEEVEVEADGWLDAEDKAIKKFDNNDRQVEIHEVVIHEEGENNEEN